MDAARQSPGDTAHRDFAADEPLPALPPLDFLAARRRLFAALIASIVIPCAFFLFYGFYTYERALTETGKSRQLLVLVIDENANTVFSINRELISHIDEMLDSGDADYITRSLAELHEKLQHLVESHPQIAALSVLDALEQPQISRAAGRALHDCSTCLAQASVASSRYPHGVERSRL